MTYVQLSDRTWNFFGNLESKIVLWGHNLLNTSRGRETFHKILSYEAFASISFPVGQLNDSTNGETFTSNSQSGCASIYLITTLIYLIKFLENHKQGSQESSSHFTFWKYRFFYVWAGFHITLGFNTDCAMVLNKIRTSLFCLDILHIWMEENLLGFSRGISLGLHLFFFIAFSHYRDKSQEAHLFRHKDLHPGLI